MTDIQYGIFKNSIPYARTGTGAKTLLFFLGGPGNGIPRGFAFSFMIAGLKLFLSEYTLYAVSRKSGLSKGYTARMMSDDYAELIRQEFGGHVDLVVGISYGGMIAQFFAADHAALCDHLVIAMATHKMTEAGTQVDVRYAKLASQGRDREAGFTMAEAIYPTGIMRWVMSPILWLLGGAFMGEKSSTYQEDILIEAQAEMTFDSVDSLQRIKTPVLLLDGENDFYFQRGSAREMAAMIPTATLKIYPGKGHDIMSEKQFGEDIREFIVSHPVSKK